jgi:DNA-directed RNA polymerase specialized sigma24 family protein
MSLQNCVGLRRSDSNTATEQALHRSFVEQQSELYWLAYLLTGHRESSLDAVMEVVDASDDANPFFNNWMAAWARKVVIAKALSAIRSELAESARRLDLAPQKDHTPRSRNWSLDEDSSKVDLERALLAIDVFPRCALLLTVFEKVSLQDAAILLDAGLELVRKAKAIGLHELTRHLSRQQSWKSAGSTPNVLTNAVQHA